MSQINQDALLGSTKALSVLFTITISLSSICLVIKLIRQQNVFDSVRKLMVIVLTLGSLLYALFSLVVKTRIAFMEITDLQCRTLVTATIYETFFFPFVYAVGLLCLALELFIVRTRTQPTSLAIRFFYIALPWVLGLVGILPLTMAGINWEHNCRWNFTIERRKAEIWMCSLLPAILVLVVAIILVCISKTNSSQMSSSQDGRNVMYNTAPQTGVAIGPTNYAYPQQYPPTPMPAIPQPAPQTGIATVPVNYNVSHQQNQFQHQPSKLPIEHHHQQQQQQFYPPPNYAYPQQFTPTPMSAIPQQNAPSAMNQVRDLRNEAVTLLKVSVIFFLFTFPFAVFTLGYQLNSERIPMKPVPNVVVNNFVYWLAVCRWLALSLCWFLCLK